MIRLILLTDFTEAFARYLLRGVLDYSKETEQWVVCRMPPSYKKQYGIKGVIKWAKSWKTDAIIGQFDNEDEISLFKQHGIIAVAQDYKSRFSSIPNITSRYREGGRMAAQFFKEKGFRHFAFVGYKNTIWSTERKEGFFEYIREYGMGEHFSAYEKESLDNAWFYNSEKLGEWLRTLPKHTALFACDDNQAIQVSEVCKTVQIAVPEDIAILGVDNDTVTCDLSDPPLSSIMTDVRRGGYEAAALIERMLKEKETIPYDIFINHLHIVNRASTDLFYTTDKEVLVAIKYIHQHIYSKINVEDVVQQVSISRRLLENRFMKEVGDTIYHYISRRKIERFTQLLVETDTPVSDIAMELGFSDCKNVARQFKTMMGCTPSVYRSKRKKQR